MLTAWLGEATGERIEEGARQPRRVDGKDSENLDPALQPSFRLQQKEDSRMQSKWRPPESLASFRVGMEKVIHFSQLGWA